MRVTTRHLASKLGVPVILDDDGKLMTTHAGLGQARVRLGLTWKQIAAEFGVSERTVQGWMSLANPIPMSAAALNVLGMLLEDRELASEKGEG